MVIFSKVCQLLLKYYAALELYSGGGTFDIGIIDDNTVPQPGMSRSYMVSFRSSIF